MTLIKTQAEGINLADTFAFTGTVSGAGAMQLVSSSTATQTGLSSLEISLPTTNDFLSLKLIVRGLKCQQTSNNHWRFRFRPQGGSVITSASYNYLMTNVYSNDSGRDSVEQSDLNAGEIQFSGYAGDGSDDSEMTSMEIDIHNSATSGRYTRGFCQKTVEKRHTDTYHYHNTGSYQVASSAVLDLIQIEVNANPPFTTYGYALYKVMV
mgnify:FL=1